MVYQFVFEKSEYSWIFYKNKKIIKRFLGRLDSTKLLPYIEKESTEIITQTRLTNITANIKKKKSLRVLLNKAVKLKTKIHFLQQTEQFLRFVCY